MHVSIGTLSLLSDKKIEAASDLLASLDMSTIIRALRQGFYDLNDLNGSRELSKKQDRAVKPLKVSVVGLETPPGLTMTRCMALTAPVEDPEQVLAGLRLHIKRRFLEAGLLKLDPIQQKKRGNDCYPTHIHIMNTGRIETNEVNNKQSRNKPPGVVRYKILAPDIRDLFAKYKDFTWADEVRLQKVSLCAMGLRNFVRGQDVVGQGYREIACAALPGTTMGELATHSKDDIVYQQLPSMRLVDPNTIYDVISR